jgi:hypothetical protein
VTAPSVASVTDALETVGIGTAKPSHSAFAVTGVPIDHDGILGHSMPDCTPPGSPTASNDVTRLTVSSKWSCHERML